jgi:hypothetical protein
MVYITYLDSQRVFFFINTLGVVYKVSIKQSSSEMPSQTSQVILTFAHFMCLFKMTHDPLYINQQLGFMQFIAQTYLVL